MKRFLILLSVAYVLCPYDLLPDFLVGLGWSDDLVLLGLLLYFFVYKKRKLGYEGAYRQGGRSAGTGGRQGSSQGGAHRTAHGMGDRAGGCNPYKVLGIGQNASPEEIKAAYRRLASKYHPDKVSHLGDEFKDLAEKRFKEIQEAYQQLVPR